MLLTNRRQKELLTSSKYDCTLENSLKVLRNVDDCPAALKIISWIKACFEPIEKLWLRNFYLVIRDHENVNTIETYTFKFEYIDNDIQTEIFRYVAKDLFLTKIVGWWLRKQFLLVSYTCFLCEDGFLSITASGRLLQMLNCLSFLPCVLAIFLHVQTWPSYLFMLGTVE